MVVVPEGLPGAIKNMFDGRGDAMIIVAARDLIGHFQHRLTGIGHGDTQAALSKNFHIIQSVPDCRDSLRVNPPTRRIWLHHRPFVDFGIEDFQQMG